MLVEVAHLRDGVKHGEPIFVGQYQRHFNGACGVLSLTHDTKYTTNFGESQVEMGKLIEKHEDHAVSMLGLHLVWCTKYRKPVLEDPAVELLVRHTIGQTCAEYGWVCIETEVMPDHVHLFTQVAHTDRPVDVVKTLKSLTAVAVFTAFPKLKSQKFWGTGLWSRGAYYGSVGNVSQETIAKYIQEQKTKGGRVSSSGTRPEVSTRKSL